MYDSSMFQRDAVDIKLPKTIPFAIMQWGIKGNLQSCSVTEVLKLSVSEEKIQNKLNINTRSHS